jgi:hypothetical protein
VRFAVFAQRGAAGFRARTLPYERFVAEVRRQNPSPGPGAEISLAGIETEGLPPIYIEPAVRVAYCDATLRVTGR